MREDHFQLINSEAQVPYIQDRDQLHESDTPFLPPHQGELLWEKTSSQ